jgi:CRISPR-associated protein Cas2
MVLITYDVSTETSEGRCRLRRVACLVDPAQWAKLRQRLIDETKLDEDSLRFYFLGKNWKGRVEHAGAQKAYDPEGPLVV